MKLKKKIISCFLIATLALTLLPVKQVIQYFLIDNQLTEELVDSHSAKKLRLLDEDHKVMHLFAHLLVPVGNGHTVSLFHYAEMLPGLRAVDVQTPPPNIG